MSIFVKAECKFIEDLTENEKVLLEMGVSVSQKFTDGEVMFDLQEVSNFNESSKGMSTVCLKNGDRFTIEVPINKFYSIMQTYVGDILDMRVK